MSIFYTNRICFFKSQHTHTHILYIHLIKRKQFLTLELKRLNLNPPPDNHSKESRDSLKTTLSPSNPHKYFQQVFAFMPCVLWGVCVCVCVGGQCWFPLRLSMQICVQSSESPELSFTLLHNTQQRRK